MTERRARQMARWIWLAAAWALMLSATAAAQNAPSGASSLDLTADSIEYDLDSGNSVYRGNVVIKQSDMEVRGDVVEVDSKDGDVRSLKVLEGGGIVRWRTASGDMLEGRGDAIEYNGDKQELRLLGNAQIQRSGQRQRITGETIVYNLRRQVLSVDGGAKRARMVVETDEPSEPREQPIRSRAKKRRQ